MNFVIVQECGGSFRFYGTKDECIAYVVQSKPELDLLICGTNENGEPQRAISWVSEDWHSKLPVKDRNTLCRTLEKNGYADVKAQIVSKKYVFTGLKDNKQWKFKYSPRKDCLISM